MVATQAQSDARTVTVEESARQLGIGRKHAYELIAEGQYPVRSIRIGRRIVVVKADLDRLLSADPSDDSAAV